MERAEAKHRALVRLWRESGSHAAADHLEHYLNGTGATLTIERDQARSFAPIREAEAKNDSRFERSFLVPEKQSGHAEKLLRLKDGQSVTFKDNWDVAYKPWNFAGQALNPDTRDYAAAFGRLALESEGKFTATRRGERIHLEGIITHRFDDPYDFHEGQPYSSEPLLLEKYGRAKPFNRKGAWNRRIKGSIRTDNGGLSEPHFV